MRQSLRTVPETGDVSGGIARFKAEGADMITFTSSSAVENFMALRLPLPANLKTASIGPVTSRRCVAWDYGWMWRQNSTMSPV